ncbi:hypothetical protein EON83_16065 [bacterium]|nr:MAG: hypothetical protein EON83_16065 [bacterium]
MQSPQNPYGQPPYGQPPAVPLPVSGPLPQLPRRIVSMDVIGEAWSYLSSNLGIWLLAMVIYVGVTWGIVAICSFLEGALPTRTSPYAQSLAIAIQIIPWVVTQLLLGGLASLALNTIRTRKANLRAMLLASNVVFPFLLSALLQSILYVLAFLPGIIILVVSMLIPFVKLGESSLTFLATGKFSAIQPSAVGGTIGGLSLGFLLLFGISLVFVALLFLATPLVVDRKAGPWGAIVQSMGTLRRHFWPSVLLVLVLGFVNVVGFLLCCIGALFTIPLTQITIALVYRDLFGNDSDQILVQTAVYPQPPIANPNG